MRSTFVVTGRRYATATPTTSTVAALPASTTTTYGFTSVGGTTMTRRNRHHTTTHPHILSSLMSIQHHQYRNSSSTSTASASPSQIDDWLHCMEFPVPQGGGHCNNTTTSYLHEEGGISNGKLKGRFIELVKRYHPDTYMMNNTSSSSKGSGVRGNKEETVEWLNAKVISIVDAHSNLKRVPQERRQRQASVADYYSSAASAKSNTTSGGGATTTTQKASYKDYEADCPWSYKPNKNNGSGNSGTDTSWGGGGMGLDYDDVPDPSGSIAWKVPRGPMAGAYRRTMFREVPSAHSQFNSKEEASRAAYRRRTDSGLHFNPFITLRAHQEQSSAAALNGPQFAVDWDVMFGKISNVKKGDIGKEEGEALDGWLKEMKGFWKRVKTEQGENPNPRPPSSSASSNTASSSSSALQSQSSNSNSSSSSSKRLPKEPTHMDRRNAQLKEDNVIQQVLVLALLLSLIAILGCYGVVLRKLFDRE